MQEPRKFRRLDLLDHRHQFRLLLCGHKAIEAGAVCMILMVQGNLTEAGLGHLLIASKTGALAVFPALGLTLTRHARHFVNRWTSSALLGIFTFVSDAVIHASHYPGKYAEAAWTGVGAFMFSVVVSYTPAGKWIDQKAEAFLHDPVGPRSVSFADREKVERSAGRPSRLPRRDVLDDV